MASNKDYTNKIYPLELRVSEARNTNLLADFDDANRRLQPLRKKTLKIDWSLPVYRQYENNDFIFSSLGNVTTLVIPVKIKPLLVGRFPTKKKLSWDKIEEWVYQLYHKLDNPIIPDTTRGGNRNADAYRIFRKNGIDYKQLVEIKKTSGCVDGVYPTFLRSSRRQIHSLLHGIPNENIVFPSIYFVVSVDYSRGKTKGWVNSCFVLPVLNASDYTIIESGNFLTHGQKIYNAQAMVTKV